MIFFWAHYSLSPRQELTAKIAIVGLGLGPTVRAPYYESEGGFPCQIPNVQLRLLYSAAADYIAKRDQTILYILNDPQRIFE